MIGTIRTNLPSGDQLLGKTLATAKIMTSRWLIFHRIMTLRPLHFLRVLVVVVASESTQVTALSNRRPYTGLLARARSPSSTVSEAARLRPPLFAR